MWWAMAAGALLGALKSKKEEGARRRAMYMKSLERRGSPWLEVDETQAPPEVDQMGRMMQGATSMGMMQQGIAQNKSDNAFRNRWLAAQESRNRGM